MPGGQSGSRPELSLVVAMDEAGLIGRDGQLPWRLPNDLAHFKRLTLGKTVLMGRRTWESLGRPLPGRDNWVLSRDPGYAPAGARVFASLDAALAAAQGRDEVLVIGGAELYRLALPRVQRMYLTQVLARIGGAAADDVHFPAYDAARFRELERQDHRADERHPYPYRFVTLERR